VLPAIVRTARLVLRRQRPDHAARIKEAVDTSLDHLRASVAWAQNAPTPLADLEARLKASAEAFNAQAQWTFTIFDSTESQVLGCVSMERADEALTALVGPDAVETGYWLRASATGSGFATEATAALVDLAFSQLKVLRVAVCHDPANIASAGVPRRLGFKSLGDVPYTVLPGRQAANESIRPTSTVWVLDAAPRG
jgi:RimJ/RimL family protein N-acetyltransferase